MFDSSPNNLPASPNPPAGGVGGPISSPASPEPQRGESPSGPPPSPAPLTDLPVSPSLGGPASPPEPPKDLPASPNPLAGGSGGPASPPASPEFQRGESLGGEEFISVMPAQFRLGKNRKAEASIHSDITNPEALTAVPKKKKTTLIIVIIAVVVLIVAAVGFLLWSKDYLKKPSAPTANQPAANQPAAPGTAELKLPPADIKDANQQELSSATLDFPAGSLSKDQTPLTFTAASTPDAATITDKTYKYLGGVYKLGPSLPAITSASLAITYTSVLVPLGASWGSDIKMAYLQGGSWVVVSSAQLDTANKKVSATFNDSAF